MKPGRGRGEFSPSRGRAPNGVSAGRRGCLSRMRRPRYAPELRAAPGGESGCAAVARREARRRTRARQSTQAGSERSTKGRSRHVLDDASGPQPERRLCGRRALVPRLLGGSRVRDRACRRVTRHERCPRLPPPQSPSCSPLARTDACLLCDAARAARLAPHPLARLEHCCEVVSVQGSNVARGARFSRKLRDRRRCRTFSSCVSGTRAGR